MEEGGIQKEVPIDEPLRINLPSSNGGVAGVPARDDEESSEVLGSDGDVRDVDSIPDEA